MHKDKRICVKRIRRKQVWANKRGRTKGRVWGRHGGAAMAAPAPPAAALHHCRQPDTAWHGMMAQGVRRQKMAAAQCELYCQWSKLGALHEGEGAVGGVVAAVSASRRGAAGQKRRRLLGRLAPGEPCCCCCSCCCCGCWGSGTLLAGCNGCLFEGDCCMSARSEVGGAAAAVVGPCSMQQWSAFSGMGSRDWGNDSQPISCL